MTGHVPAPAGVSTSRGTECRVWERHPCDLQVGCQPVAGYSERDAMWPAKFRDLSAGGVGLVVCRRFERGVKLAIEIPGAADRSAEVLLARVVHVRQMPEGQWFMGCAFTSELSADEVQTLLTQAFSGQSVGNVAQPAAGSGSPADEDKAGQGAVETVRMAKAAYTVPSVYLRIAAPGSMTLVRVPQLFLTGPWPVPSGTVLKVRARSAGGAGRQVKLLVERCEQDEGRWVIECRMVGGKDAESLSLLGLGRVAGGE